MPDGLYVYCIIGTGEARNFNLKGIGDRGDTVTTIAYGELSAVVSSVPMSNYVISREVMLCHEEVLEKVMQDYTILPVRFYTVAPNAEEIRRLLRTRYTEFKTLLRELDNKVEVSLKAYWKDMNRVMLALLKHGPSAQRSVAAGQARLVTGIAQAERGSLTALEERPAQMRELLLKSLKPLAVDVRLNNSYGENMILNASVFVDRSREKDLDTLVERLSAQYAESVAFQYVGPIPPYSFVNIVIKGEAFGD